MSGAGETRPKFVRRAGFWSWVDTTKSGRVYDPQKGLVGFFITGEDYHRLENLLTNLAVDGGTQPAYGRGIFRGMGGLAAVLHNGRSPESAFANPLHDTGWFDLLRRERRRFQ